MFYIIETQEQADGTAAMLTYQEQTKNDALSKWHSVLSFAAVSSIYIHSCIVLDSELKTIAKESFKHISVGDTNEE